MPETLANVGPGTDGRSKESQARSQQKAPSKNTERKNTQESTFLEKLALGFGCFLMAVAYGYASGTYQLPKSLQEVTKYQQPAPTSTPTVNNLVQQLGADVRELVHGKN